MGDGQQDVGLLAQLHFLLPALRDQRRLLRFIFCYRGFAFCEDRDYLPELVDGLLKISLVEVR